MLKGRFAILRIAPRYDFVHQVSILHACCTLHNFILEQNGALPDTDETISSDGVQSEEEGNEVDLTRVFRHKLWDEYQMNRTHGSV